MCTHKQTLPRAARLLNRWMNDLNPSHKLEQKRTKKNKIQSWGAVSGQCASTQEGGGCARGRGGCARSSSRAHNTGTVRRYRTPHIAQTSPAELAVGSSDARLRVYTNKQCAAAYGRRVCEG
eukprot:scaffold24729_cov117-Isochrysis_galbana.AAC.4